MTQNLDPNKQKKDEPGMSSEQPEEPTKRDSGNPVVNAVTGTAQAIGQGVAMAAKGGLDAYKISGGTAQTGQTSEARVAGEVTQATAKVVTGAATSGMSEGMNHP